MAYLYLLYTYTEQGPHGLVATLDRATLIDLYRQTWPDIDVTETGMRRLAECLTQEDATLANGENWDLEESWGGVQLRVVALYDGGQPL